MDDNSSDCLMEPNASDLQVEYRMVLGGWQLLGAINRGQEYQKGQDASKTCP